MAQVNPSMEDEDIIEPVPRASLRATGSQKWTTSPKMDSPRKTWGSIAMAVTTEQPIPTVTRSTMRINPTQRSLKQTLDSQARDWISTGLVCPWARCWFKRELMSGSRAIRVLASTLRILAAIKCRQQVWMRWMVMARLWIAECSHTLKFKIWWAQMDWR